LMLSCGQFAATSTANSQACGCGKTKVYVGNEKGEVVRNVTLEYFYPGSRILVTDCLKRAPAKQTGTKGQFKFVFGSPELGGPDGVTLRVTAPGYETYEQRGPLLQGCYLTVEVVLKKSSAGRRVKAHSRGKSLSMARLHP
jgi:hypothetical protein